jgi:DsbC/DsbD-like thiol-disulfide interchange protein
MSRSRTATRLLSLALAVLAVALLFSGRTASAVESKDQVKITATADKPDAEGKQTVTITLEVQKPWHLYANPVKNEDMVSSQTTVKFTANNKPAEDAKIKYPEGSEVKDATVGNYFVYEGKVEITATVRRAKDDTSPLEATISLHACDKDKCLLPSIVKVKVEQK